jgi:NAD(P)-dependent dehydrogenase (short-subunit alcohol dehydrogenase family)
VPADDRARWQAIARDGKRRKGETMNDTFDVRGQAAIVTGAATGIGRAIARRLAADGMNVTIADLNADGALAVAREAAEHGVKTLGLRIDITKAADRERMIEQTREAFGRFDVLVNNAGIQIVADPLDVDEAHWDRMLDVNAKGTWFACQSAIRTMLEHGTRGRIVNLASIAGKMASTVLHPVYNVSKAAVLAMTKTYAAAYASKGIRINAVCPGVIVTDMQDAVDAQFGKLQGRAPEAVRADRMSRIPLGYAGDPDVIAGVVSMLAGNDGRYLTGQAINVDGGIVTY